MKSQIHITRFHLDSLYRIMLKRIAKGYSTQELSFLIGRETDYIHQVETFQLPLYTDEELRQIAAALDEPIAADLLVATADDTEQLSLSVEAVQEEQTLTKSYYLIKGEDQYKLIFRLKEGLLTNNNENRAHLACLQRVKLLIETLHQAGYFHWTQHALEIFQALRPLTSFKLTPFLVQQALEGMWDEENPHRILDKEVENGLCYGYGER